MIRDEIGAETAKTGAVGSKASALWQVLGVVGWAFLLVGAADLVLTFAPPRFGNPEWEFGTISAALNGMPVPFLGLGLVTARAIAVGSAISLRIIAIGCMMLGVALLALGAVYGLTLPLAAKGFEVPTLEIGLKRAMSKSLVQLLVYSVVSFWLGVRSWKLAGHVAA